MMPAMSLIVVGIDGSEDGRKGLRWALEEARLRNATLRVVHAWVLLPPPAPMGLTPPMAPTAEEIELLREASEKLLEHELSELVGDDPGISVEPKAVEDLPAQALINEAEEAELVVVGSRGHGGFAGLLLGSVSQQVAHHAPCPVVIVRQREAS
jgi:nucleotide-binding universal stress UspA family protein